MLQTPNEFFISLFQQTNQVIILLFLAAITIQLTVTIIRKSYLFLVDTFKMMIFLCYFIVVYLILECITETVKLILIKN